MKNNRTCLERARVKTVRLSDINLDLCHANARGGYLDQDWVRDLARLYTANGELNPITIWSDPKQPGELPLVVDGHHRIAAYRGLKKSKIKARVLDCSYKEMLLISGRLHLDASLPLTQAERSDFAWRLVAEELGYTKKETSQATGIGVRTIGYMRATLKDLKSREIEPPCTWWEAKRAQRGEEDELPEFKYDEEAERQIEGAAKLIWKVLDQAKKEFPMMRLMEVRAEVLQRSHGTYEFQNLASYLGYQYEEDEDDLDPYSFPVCVGHDPYEETEDEKDYGF